MKRMIKTMMMTWVVLLTFSSAVHAGPDHQAPADTSSAEFKKIKALEGKWVTTTSAFGKKNQKVYTQFEVTSGGAAVMERIFPGTKEEMVSVYYDDGNGKLAMTHYCLLRNRPTMKLAKVDGDTMTLAVKKIDGPKVKGHSMGDMTLKIKDKNHFVSTCKGKMDGKNMKHTFEYTRVK